MTVEELIEELKVLQEELGKDAVVRLASNPQYPMEYHTGDEVVGYVSEEGESVILLTESMQIGYLPREARNALNW